MFDSYTYSFRFINLEKYLYEDCLFYFGIWQPQCCNLPTDSSIVKLDIFEVICTQNVLTYEHYLCCLQQLKRFISAKKMELNREHFRAIIFYNYRRGLTQHQCSDELNSIFGVEALSSTSIYRFIVNSTQVVVHSKTNFVKVVQNQLLLRKPLMLYAN